MPSILDILTPSLVTKVVSRVRTPGNALSRAFGFQIGGPNVRQVSGQVYTYDIFDNVRQVARARMPGASASTRAPQAVGNVTVSLARSAEKIPMDYAAVSQIRKIGENAGTIDRMGVGYIERQAMTLRQAQDNFREFMVAGALFRGGQYSFIQSGDDLLPTFDTSGVTLGVDHKIPSSNKLTGGSFAAGLQMGTGSNIITATWATASTDIPLALMQISAAFMDQVGQPLKHVWLDSATWLYVLQNDKVRQLAGTNSEPFASNEMTADKNPDGTPTGMLTGRIKGLPWLEWHVYDGSLEVVTVAAPTTWSATKLIPTSYCTFTIDLDPSWFALVEGSEPVKENDLAPAKEVYGFHSWVMERADPARFELHALQRAGIELNIPKGIAWARVR